MKVSYMRFSLKLNGYGIKDWKWIAEKKNEPITNICCKWLLSGGIQTLVKYFLKDIPLFWHTLAYISKGVLGKIEG